MKPPRKSTLLPAQAELVELMQQLDFGNVEGLVIRNGLPVLKPRPRLIRDVKFGAGNGRRSESGLTDFALKSSVQELIVPTINSSVLSNKQLGDRVKRSC